MKLTRREVYQLVWSAPMTSIGRLLGISSVSLAKTCERRGIPTPTRGYWQKVAAGHDLPPRPPLGEVEVELPMPWERTPDVDAALARVMPSAASEVPSSPPEAPIARAEKAATTRSERSSDRLSGLRQSGSEGADQDVEPEARQPLPMDVETAIQLARRIEDLRALSSLTELALAAGAVLPACEEDRLRTWVTQIRIAMRDIDPLRQLVKGAGVAPRSVVGTHGGQA